jgi:hypothetical protein
MSRDSLVGSAHLSRYLARSRHSKTLERGQDTCMGASCIVTCRLSGIMLCDDTLVVNARPAS